MPNNIPHQPRPVPQVMVSSTFTDLAEHRAALIKAMQQHSLFANVMENDSARLVDVIDSSLEMVRVSAAYIGVIGHKYGQTPECADRNPDTLSITELEFNEALQLGRPILLFIMGDDHPVTKADIERDPDKERKLDAFRERAKKSLTGSQVDRVYSVFNSLEDFKGEIGSPLAELSGHLASADAEAPQDPAPAPATADVNAIPTPPAFYTEPDYIGSHQFVGRDSQLEELDDWAKPADPTNVLLFEAIGGNGKSMLTWEWTTNPKHATQVRDAHEAAWAGRFWYSFYEHGAIMADFCQRALAYMTGQPLKQLRKKKTAELREPLLAQLHAKPWLLILDGLERVLVAYHRIDAAEMPDEDANSPTDKIVDRNPCDAIRDEDNDLLRALAAAAPSKILVSSRLTPRVLLNPSGQPITGVKRITLPGLRPTDAERLLRSCGIEGDSATIQSYLTTNCDNHPLVIGIVGGLIHNYLPARGNFDAWVADPDGGAKLDLANLDLIQRRNHILRAALDALPSASRQLLSTLALLSESVDYETLCAFNPHDPPDANKLAETVTDLEQRGLLQYDGRTRRHDLHPVVRGVAAGGMKAEDKERYGKRVTDYFSSLPHNPYEQAETLEDLRPGLSVVRTLLKLGHLRNAAHAFAELADALLFNVEAHEETLCLMRSYFPTGWEKLPKGIDDWDAVYLANYTANALSLFGATREALATYSTALPLCLERENWSGASSLLHNISSVLNEQNMLKKGLRVAALALNVAAVRGDSQDVFTSRLRLFSDHSRLGQWDDAETFWQLLDTMGRVWSRHAYIPGDAEWRFARLQYWKGTLKESHLDAAERLAAEGKNRIDIRDLHSLRGAWRLEQGEWAQAAASFAEAVRMSRESGIPDAESETGLALAKHHRGQLAEPQREAERLVQLRQPAHRLLAQLWLALGDHEQAKHHALAAYRWAWADGEPYVHRYELTKTTELLQQMNVPIPNLPPYDAAKDEPFPWEADVRAAIEKLRAEKEAKEKSDELCAVRVGRRRWPAKAFGARWRVVTTRNSPADLPIPPGTSARLSSNDIPLPTSSPSYSNGRKRSPTLRVVGFRSIPWVYKSANVILKEP